MTAAVDAITRRSIKWTTGQKEASPAPTAGPWPNSEAKIYQESIRRLHQQPNSLTMRQEVLDQIVRQSPMEPVFEYAEAYKLRPEPRNRPRLDLLALAFAYPTQEERDDRQRATFATGETAAVPVAESRTMVERVREAGGLARLTVYPDATHDSWTRTYENDDFYAWLLKQRRHAARVMDAESPRDSVQEA